MDDNDSVKTTAESAKRHEGDCNIGYNDKDTTSDSTAGGRMSANYYYYYNDDKISSKIKSNVFEYIKNSKTLPELLASRNMSGVIRDIVSACHLDAAGSGLPYGQAMGVLATSIIHYALTISMIKSMRKVRYEKVDIDVAIPDVKTIRSDPKQALVIYIAMTDDWQQIRADLESVLAIHPERANVWAVVAEGADRIWGRDVYDHNYADSKVITSRHKAVPDCADFADSKADAAAKKTGAESVRRFVITRDGGSFADCMLDEITRFIGRNAGGSRGSEKLRIMGSVMPDAHH